MKIWLMNHYASNMYRDCAGRHYWFAERLFKLGHDVTIFCASTYLNGEYAVNLERNTSVVKKQHSIPFVFVKTSVSHSNGVNRIMNMYRFYKNLFPVTRQYEKEYGKPDVILASSVHPLTMVAGIKIAKKMGIPCICEVRDLWPEAIFQFGRAKENSLLGKILIKGEHWIYKNADALIFTKEGDVDYLKEKKWTIEQGGDIDLGKCHYINNGINLDTCDNRSKNIILEDEDLKDNSKFNVTYVGAIRPVNNVGNILTSAFLLQKNKSYEDICFLVYGDGIQLEELRERVKKEGLKNVKLKGFVNRQYVPYILSKSSLNILNYSQGQYNWTRGNSSNKLFEYMASGKPIISTVRMGYSIINRYQCGVELEQDTHELLAEQIIRFHDMSKEERDNIGKNAREGAKDFDFKILTDKLLTVIESVVRC